MATSLLTDVTAALDDNTLARISQRLDTPAILVRYGLDLASRKILNKLAKCSGSKSGAELVFSSVDSYDGSILAKIGTETGPNQQHVALDEYLALDQYIAKGVDSLTMLLGSEFDDLATAVQTSSDTTEESANNVVGLAAVLVFDALGRQRKLNNLDPEKMQTLLQSQSSERIEPTARGEQTSTSMLAELGLAPSAVQQTVPLPTPTSTGTSQLDLGKTTPTPPTPVTKTDTPTQTPKTVPTAEPLADTVAKTPPTGDSPKNASAATSPPTRPASKSTTSLNLAKPKQPKINHQTGGKDFKRLTFRLVKYGVPVAFVLGTAVYGWFKFQERSQATPIAAAVTGPSATLTSFPSESHETPRQNPTAASTSAPDTSHVDTASKVETQRIKIDLGKPRILPLPRHEDDWLQETFAPIAKLHQAEESKEEFDWDTKNQPLEPGKMRVGVWQVTESPRNAASKSVFTYP